MHGIKLAKIEIITTSVERFGAEHVDIRVAGKIELRNFSNSDTT